MILKMAERGFLLLCFLMVFALLLTVVVLGLAATPWLWRAGGAILAHGEQQNTQRAVRVQLQQWLDQQRIPPVCWHHSKDIEAAKANFSARPALGCLVGIDGTDTFYWLEQWPQINARAPQTRAYQLWLMGPLGFSEVYGFATRGESSRQAHLKYSHIARLCEPR